MNIEEHYNQLYINSSSQIKADLYSVDKLINSPLDKRLGITLLLRPDKAVKNEIQKFLDEMRVIEPSQYFYPDSDLHVTVLSIISCYDGFLLSQIAVDEYIELINKSLLGVEAFAIEFKGVTLSPSCVMIQGFFNDHVLSLVRDRLRANFKKSGLVHSIDTRYAIQTAHSTVFRLREKLTNKDKFLNLVAQYRDHLFGTFTVNTLELVCNDWYLRKECVRKLCNFKLDLPPDPFSDSTEQN